MNRLYIFGLGSPYGGDQIGWLATDRLRPILESNSGIVVDTLSHPTTLFSQPMTPDDEILFLDTMIGQALPGTVQQFGPLTLPPAKPRLSTHGIDLRTTVALLTGMGTPDEQIHIFAVEAPRTEGDAAERAPVQNLEPAIAALVSAVTHWIDHRSK